MTRVDAQTDGALEHGIGRRKDAGGINECVSGPSRLQHVHGWGAGRPRQLEGGTHATGFNTVMRV